MSRPSSSSPHHRELQQADRALSWCRRHEDRLHLRVRLQSCRHRDAQQQAADRRRAWCAIICAARTQGGAVARRARFNGNNRTGFLKAFAGTADPRTDRCVAAEPARRNVVETQGLAVKMRKTIRTSWWIATAPIPEYRCSRPAFRLRP